MTVSLFARPSNPVETVIEGRLRSSSGSRRGRDERWGYEVRAADCRRRRSRKRANMMVTSGRQHEQSPSLAGDPPGGKAAGLPAAAHLETPAERGSARLVHG